ncbi:MAG: ComEC/Rec2 family competence protein, partial [Thermodesulfobacteriota bacterium]
LMNLNHFLVLALVKVLSLLTSLPFASFYLPTPSPLEILLFYLLLLVSLHLRRRRLYQVLFATIVFIFALDFAYWNLNGYFQKELKITFIDVGQGDSIFIEFPKGKRMLIDGGGLYGDHFDIGKKVIAPFLWKKRVRRIDYLVLTHPDPDHLKGLLFIASHFSIGQFWENGICVESPSYQELEEILSRKRIKRHILNTSIPPLHIHGVELSFLHPPPRKLPQREKWDSSFINNQSLVMKLKFKNIQVLLTGDIEEEAEYRMLMEGLPLKADVLKIPHHGSLSSSTLPFLQRVQPIYAILSAGNRNRGRLPHPEVLKRYESLGIKVLRTDQQGAISITTDGEKMKIKSFLKMKE